VNACIREIVDGDSRGGLAMTMISAPPGFEPPRSDVPWNARYLDLRRPERVFTLDELGEGAAGPSALSPVAITSPFRVLSDEGAEVLQRIASELQGVARSSERLPKFARGVVYRSQFLRGLYGDPELLDFLRELAQAPLEPHPVSHHAAQLNFAPDDLARNVDQWHCDVVSFDFVLMVSDPRPMKGGRFEYFEGSVEEGRELLVEGPGLPPERVVRVEFPGAGWAVLQQGHRVLHRAARLEERYPRITMVCSYYTPHTEIDDPTDLATLRKVDGREVALVEWSRYAAVVAARRLEHFAASGAELGRPLEEVREGLRRSIAGVEEAIAAFDSDDEGRLIAFGEGT
jgi:hypothetical protein